MYMNAFEELGRHIQTNTDEENHLSWHGDSLMIGSKTLTNYGWLVA